VRHARASLLAGIAPPAALAATLAAACLLPSFTQDLLFPAAGDLLTVAGLLMLARLLAALAGGEAAPAALLPGEPALLLALFLRILPGTTAAAPLGLAALALAVGALLSSPSPAPAASGGDLALLELAGLLRRLVFFSLLAGQVLPALPSGPEWWLPGLALWLAAIALLAGGLAVAETLLPPWRPARRREALAAGLLLALLAALTGLAEFAP
jgi:formate hydrogenlyase subunit 4